jgi:Protein tyrosine and serine/threonine kinase
MEMANTVLFHRGTTTSESAAPEELSKASCGYDLISFLAYAQNCNVPLVSLPWHSGLPRLGKGGTGLVVEALVDIERSFAFKRFSPLDVFSRPVPDSRRFQNLLSELAVLQIPHVRDHDNIVDLIAITWEYDRSTRRVWPVLVTPKAKYGDLQSFLLSSEERRAASFEARIKLCIDIANAIDVMHNCSKLFREGFH